MCGRHSYVACWQRDQFAVLAQRLPGLTSDNIVEGCAICRVLQAFQCSHHPQHRMRTGLMQMLGTLQQTVRRRPHVEDGAAVRTTRLHSAGLSYPHGQSFCYALAAMLLKQCILAPLMSECAH